MVSRKTLMALLVLVNAMWGGGMIAMKFALVSFSPMQVVFGRVAFACVVYLAVWRCWHPLPYRPGDWKYLAGLALFEPCLLFLCETYSMRFTTASQGGVIAACFPLCTALAARLFLKEKLARRTLGGMALAVTGVAVASLAAADSAQAARPLLGNLFMLGAVLSSTGYAVCARFVARRYSFVAVSAIQSLGGAAAFLPLACLSPWPRAVEGSALAALLYLGLGVGLIVYLLFNFALERLEAGVVALFGNLIPVFTLLFAFTLLGERLTPLQAAGVALTLGGVLIAAWPGRARPDPAANPSCRPAIAATPQPPRPAEPAPRPD